MKKVTVKNLIEFRGKNERTRVTFVKNLKKEKKKTEDSSGGDYWISCLSAIRNAFKYENEELLDEKIDVLFEKIKSAELQRIKAQFQKNIDILINFKDYDFKHLRPDTELTFLKQSSQNSLLNINGIPVESKPCHIFTFSINNSDEIGGVWFIAKLKGFKRSELGMFVDILHRYLVKHYSGDFYINPDYCIAVDLYNGQEVTFTDIKKGNIPLLIDKTIDELKRF